MMTSYGNENYRYFLLVVNAVSKYVWTIPLKSTKGIEIVMLFTDDFRPS
jgi:hypothetical protein